MAQTHDTRARQFLDWGGPIGGTENRAWRRSLLWRQSAKNRVLWARQREENQQMAPERRADASFDRLRLLAPKPGLSTSITYTNLTAIGQYQY